MFITFPLGLHAFTPHVMINSTSWIRLLAGWLEVLSDQLITRLTKCIIFRRCGTRRLGGTDVTEVLPTKGWHSATLAAIRRGLGKKIQADLIAGTIDRIEPVLKRIMYTSLVRTLKFVIIVRQVIKFHRVVKGKCVSLTIRQALGRNREATRKRKSIVIPKGK